LKIDGIAEVKEKVRKTCLLYKYVPADC